VHPLALASLTVVSAHGSGAWLDLKYHNAEKAYSGMRYVSETKHNLTLIGSDDGESWFSVSGYCEGPSMTRIHFDFSPKGGPKHASATWSKDSTAVRLTWDDGNVWLLQAATFDSNLVPGGPATTLTPFQAAAGFWFPLAGVFTSNALFMAPFTAVLARVQAKSLGKLNPLPVGMTVLSSWAWLQYGLSVPDPYIVAGNLPALTAAVYGLLLMLPLMHEARHAPALQMVVRVFVGGCFVAFSLWAYLIFARVDSAQRSSTLGSYATVIFIVCTHGSHSARSHSHVHTASHRVTTDGDGIGACSQVLAASPLSSMRTVLATRDASSIYAPMTAAQCVNCMLWTVYGLAAAHDVFVWGPNLTGLVLGLMQLALKLCFPSTPRALARSDASRMSATDVEMMDDPEL
jgi:hypothetical protein